MSLQVGLQAALPKLSSIDPIEYDTEAQRLIARGDARLNLDTTQVGADSITYYQEYAVADAVGNAAIMHEGYRLIGERISYDAEENIFSIQEPRTGAWPLYTNAVTAGGSLEDMKLVNARIYYTDPGPFTPNIKAKSLQYNNEDGKETLTIKGATLQIGNVPFFYLPVYTYDVNKQPFYLDVDAGSNSNLGTFLQTTSLIPVTPEIRLGANADFYTERGFLVGPAAQYVHMGDTHRIKGALSAGFISDSGDAGLDVYDNPINSSRNFVEWRHKHHLGEKTTLTANISYRSDSEVMRDFREGLYRKNQEPDTFLEAAYAGDNYLLTAFTRANLSDFQLVQERLPEVRFDWLPTPLAQTGAYQDGSISYARLREDYNTIPVLPTATSSRSYDRLDLNYQIARPFFIKNWLNFTPLISTRLSHYSNQSTNPDSSLAAATHNRFAAGFDLATEGRTTFNTRNSIWQVDGLRHVLRPIIRYRYFTKASNSDPITEIERAAYDLNRPLLDLNQLRYLDTLEKTHLVRFGLENLYQTRNKTYGSRTLAALNLYQDILLAREQLRFDGTAPKTLHATWVELALKPAPWLKFDLAARLKTSSLSLEELLTRTTLISGDTWQLGISTDLLLDVIDQYRLYYQYRIDENHSFLANTRYNSKGGSFDYTNFGLLTHFGSAWELLYGLTLRNNTTRKSDVEFSVGLNLVEP